MIDAEQVLRAARRPLVIGIGGGGDVVGALVTAEGCRLYDGADPIVGGLSWERQPVDPRPGPRSLDEIEHAEVIAPFVALAGPRTRIRDGGIPFAESRMAEFLGTATLLIDPGGGARRIADGIAEARRRLDGDLIIFIDVGGDVLADGSEPGLGSPLCDALMLAAAKQLQDEGHPVLAGVFGPGCDGELTLAEVAAHLSELGRVGALAGARGVTPQVATRLEAALETVVTEASAQPLRAFRGVAGTAVIRGGRRTLELTPAAALTIFFDAGAAFDSVARLARIAATGDSLVEASRALNAAGVRTELDGELRLAESAGPAA